MKGFGLVKFRPRLVWVQMDFKLLKGVVFLGLRWRELRIFVYGNEWKSFEEF